MSGVEKAKEFFEQAFVLEQEGKLDDALFACDKALQIDRNYADAHNLRGIVLERLGRKQDALTAYQEAIWADPNFEEAQENLNALKAEQRAPITNAIKISARTGLYCALACALIFGWTEAMRLAIFPLDYSGQNYWIPYIAYIFLSLIQFGLSCLLFARLTKPTGRAIASLISGLIAGIPYVLITLAANFLLRFGILDFDPLSADYFIWGVSALVCGFVLGTGLNLTNKINQKWLALPLIAIFAMLISWLAGNLLDLRIFDWLSKSVYVDPTDIGQLTSLSIPVRVLTEAFRGALFGFLISATLQWLKTSGYTKSRAS